MTVLEHFIASGGIFISAFDSGSVNRADFPLFQGGGRRSSNLIFCSSFNMSR